MAGAYSIFVLIGLIQLSSTYRTDILEEMEANFCEYRKHLTFKPSATCCMKQVLKPGINPAQHWDACQNEVAGKSNTIADIGWDMYSCVVKKTNGGKDKISLKEFSDLMTASYPDDIKTQISDEIGKQKVSSASLTDYVKLEKIRVTYYDIEQEVCEGMPSETKAYGKIELCSTTKEENHRGGLCCKKAYPVDIRFKSLMDPENRQEMIEQCRMDIHEHLYKLNVSDIMESSLMEICDVACGLKNEGKIPFKEHIIDNTEYWKWNWTFELSKFPILPNQFHQELRQKAREYVGTVFNISNTIDAMKNFEFADVINGDSNTFRSVNTLTYVARGNKSIPGEDFKYDFMRRRFHPNMMQVPVICSAYKEILSLMEYALYRKENCQPEEPEQAPEESAPEETAPENEPEPPAATEPPAESDTQEEEGTTEGPSE